MFKNLSLELLGTNNKLVGGCDVHTYFSYFYIIHVHHYHIFLLVLAILDHFGFIDDYMDLVQLLQIMPDNSMKSEIYYISSRSYELTILIISDACGPIFIFLDFLYIFVDLLLI